MEDAWSVNYDIELCVVHKELTNNHKCCCYPCKLHMKVVFSHHIYMYLATHIIILSPSCLYILCYTT